MAGAMGTLLTWSVPVLSSWALVFPTCTLHHPDVGQGQSRLPEATSSMGPPVLSLRHLALATNLQVWARELVHTDLSSVQSLNRVQLFATPWTATCQAFLSITNSQSLLKLKSIELVMPSSHLILCRPLLLPPSIFHSIRVFSTESAFHIRWPKYWSFSISPSNEYSGLISFKIDWFDLLDFFDCIDHNKLWKILKETGVLDYLTCLLRNVYAGQEATVRTGQGV